MLTYNATLDKISTIDEGLRSWVSGTIPVTVATSLFDDAPHIINLNETIGHEKYAPKPLKRSDSNCYWLPSIYSTNDALSRANHIIPLFVRACRDAMFKVGGSYERKWSVIVFECIRSTINDHEKNAHNTLKYRCNKNLKKPHDPPLPKKRKTQRPPKIELNDSMNHLFTSPSELHTCKFRFQVFWDESHSRWFLPMKQSGCTRHFGHLPIESSLIRMKTSHAISSLELGVANNSLQSDIAATQTAALVATRTGEELEWHQLHYLKTKGHTWRMGSSRVPRN